MVLKTLHFTNSWHASSGGIGTFYRALLEGANRTGWEMRLVVPGVENKVEDSGPFARIYHVRAPRAPIHPEYRVLYPHTFLLPGSPLREILRAEQPHVIEVNDKYTLLYLAGLLRIGKIRELRRRAAVAAISCERMDQTLTAYSGMPQFSSWFSRAYMKCLYFPQADHHIAVSRSVAEELETASRGHKVARGVWIRGMGVDAVCFTPERRGRAVRQALLHRAGADPDTALLLYAGRLAPEKNLPLLLDLLDALAAKVDAKLLIAGDGPSREEFLAAAKHRAPGRAVYLDHVRDRGNFADLLANVDIFLHPNPREPFGIAPLEAMASGTPLAAPNRGGVTSYANEGNAWLAEPTGDAFAQAARSILTDSSERARRTAAARETALRLDWPVVCRGFHALYQDLYARTQGSSTSIEPAFYSTPGNWLGMEIEQPV